VAESLIKPEIAKPKGTPPKKLLVGGFGLLVTVVILLSLFTTREDKPNTGDGQARDSAAVLSESERNQVGNTAMVVRDAVATTGLPADFRGGDVAPGPLPGAQPRAGAARPAQAASAAQPPALPANAPAAPLAVDPAVAARELETLNSRTLVFDQEDRGAQRGPGQDLDADRPQVNAAQAAPAARATQTMSAANNGSERVEDVIAKRLAAAKAPQDSLSPRQRDTQFLQEFADQRKQPGLRPTRPEASNVILEGTVIPAVLTRDIVTDLPGVVSAMVNRNVYDSLRPEKVLVCKGARLVGRYNNEVKAGQSRLLFAFQRLILQDGSSFDLGGFDGSDLAGRAGVAGDVDNHFFRIYGTSLLIGLLADRVTKVQVVPQGQAAQMSATGRIMADTARDNLQRYRDVAPTITIERGTPINVEVRRDLNFPVSLLRGCA
jgi:type IV secretion system protein TrbI